MTTCSEIFMVSPNAAFQHCDKLQCGRLFFWSSRVWTTVKAQRNKIASWSCENGGERVGSEEATVDGNGPEVEILAQDRSSVDREELHECVHCHQRTNAQLGGHGASMDCKQICAKVMRCRCRWRQFHWRESENDLWSVPHPQRLKIYRWEDMVAGEIAKFIGNACDFSESVQESTGWFQNRKRWMQFAKCGKSIVLMVPGASGTHVRPACLGRMQVLLGSCGVEWFSLMSFTAPILDDTERNRECEVW